MCCVCARCWIYISCVDSGSVGEGRTGSGLLVVRELEVDKYASPCLFYC